jgi:hypothetical protein
MMFFLLDTGGRALTRRLVALGFGDYGRAAAA